MSTSALVRRWAAFNGVGVMGVGVQLAALALLVRAMEVPYLWATAAAVEIAVLHNFAWHERWTWSNRRSGSTTVRLGRLARFHLLNGIVSLAGNLALMHVLTGSHGMDPITANVVAIMCCSAVNFAGSEKLVFTRRAAVPIVLCVLCLSTADLRASDSPDVELDPKTVDAWLAYEKRVDARYAAADSAAPFFALDAYGIGAWRERAMRGTVAMHQLERAEPGGREIDVPGGKIHHWIGAIFVPARSLDQVLLRLSEQAGRESESYEDVIASKLLSRNGDVYRVYMKLQRTKFITVTYNTEHTVVYRRLSERRATARSVATRIAELEDAGTPREREKPVGSDSGFLWRLNAYWRYEQVDGGVLIECESVSLSRSVPLILRSFVTGMVERVARDSLERTLLTLKKVLTRR